MPKAVRSSAALAAGCAPRTIEMAEISTYAGTRVVTAEATLFDSFSDRVGGLAIHPLTGAYYLASDDLLGCGSGTFRLWSYDPETHLVALIGSHANWTIDDLAFRADGTLYGFAETDGAGAEVDDIVTIDLASGLPSIVGNSGFGGSDGRLAFAPDGTLYIGLGSIIGTVDPDTGVASFIGIQTGFTNETMAIDDSGIGYLVSGHESLQTFNVSAPIVLSSPSPMGLQAVTALAFVPSEFTLTGKDGVKCANKIVKGASLLAKAGGKLAAGCLKERQKDPGAGFGACLDADAKQFESKAAAKLLGFETKSCSTPPDYGVLDGAAIAAAVPAARRQVVDGLFGAGAAADATIVAAADDKVGAACQSKMAKLLQKQADLVLKDYAKCVKIRGKELEICSIDDYGVCMLLASLNVEFGVGAAGKVLDKADKLRVKCQDQGVDFGALFATSSCSEGDLGCLTDLAICSACATASGVSASEVPCSFFKTAGGACPD